MTGEKKQPRPDQIASKEDGFLDVNEGIDLNSEECREFFKNADEFRDQVREDLKKYDSHSSVWSNIKKNYNKLRRVLGLF